MAKAISESMDLIQVSFPSRVESVRDVQFWPNSSTLLATTWWRESPDMLLVCGLAITISQTLKMMTTPPFSALPTKWWDTLLKARSRECFSFRQPVCDMIWHLKFPCRQFQNLLVGLQKCENSICTAVIYVYGRPSHISVREEGPRPQNMQ